MQVPRVAQVGRDDGDVDAAAVHLAKVAPPQRLPPDVIVVHVAKEELHEHRGERRAVGERRRARLRPEPGRQVVLPDVVRPAAVLTVGQRVALIGGQAVEVRGGGLVVADLHHPPVGRGTLLLDVTHSNGGGPLAAPPPARLELRLLRRDQGAQGLNHATLPRADPPRRSPEEAARAYAEAMTPEDIAKLPAADLTSEQAQAQADAEQLTLHLAPGTKTGYRGINVQKKSATHPFSAVLHSEGTSRHLGCFATKEEAALAYARAYAQKPPPPPPPVNEPDERATLQAMTAEEAEAAAAEEGLTLQHAATQTGFKGVWTRRKSKVRPFAAEFRTRKLGSFATAEAAALAFSRAEAHHKAQPCGTGRLCTCALPWLLPAAVDEPQDEDAQEDGAQPPVLMLPPPPLMQLPQVEVTVVAVVATPVACEGDVVGAAHDGSVAG
eukprot:5177337-Prymnesium_polylepis.2